MGASYNIRHNKIKRMKGQITQLRMKNRNLAAELQKQENEKNEYYKPRIDLLKERLDQLEGRVNDHGINEDGVCKLPGCVGIKLSLRDQIDKAREEKERLKRDLDKSSARLDTVTREVEVLKTQLKGAKEGENDYQANPKKIAENGTRQEEKIVVQLKARVTALEGYIQGLKTKLQKYEQALKTRDADTQDDGEHNKDHRKEYEEEDGDLEKIKNTFYESSGSEYEPLLPREAVTLKEKDELIDEQERKISQLQKILAKRTSHIVYLKGIAEGLEASSLPEAQKIPGKLFEELTTNQKALDECLHHKAQLENELEALRSENVLLKQEGSKKKPAPKARGKTGRQGKGANKRKRPTHDNDNDDEYDPEIDEEDPEDPKVIQEKQDEKITELERHRAQLQADLDAAKEEIRVLRNKDLLNSDERFVELQRIHENLQTRFDEISKNLVECKCCPPTPPHSTYLTILLSLIGRG